MFTGSSAGGILAFMLVWERPEAFSRALCMSPAFMKPHAGPQDWNYVTCVGDDSVAPKGVRFYIDIGDIGGIGLEEELQPEWSGCCLR